MHSFKVFSINQDVRQKINPSDTIEPYYLNLSQHAVKFCGRESQNNLSNFLHIFAVLYDDFRFKNERFANFNQILFILYRTSIFSTNIKITSLYDVSTQN